MQSDCEMVDVSGNGSRHLSAKRFPTDRNSWHKWRQTRLKSIAYMYVTQKGIRGAGSCRMTGVIEVFACRSVEDQDDWVIAVS